MTNIVFAADHCQVVELCGLTVPGFYPNLAHAFGLSFYLVQGTIAPPIGVDLQFHDEFSVNILELERHLGGLASVRSRDTELVRVLKPLDISADHEGGLS